MTHVLLRGPALLVCLALVFAFPSTSAAQGGTTSTLSGVVMDTAGGVVPGADVTIKHKGTGVSDSTVSNAEGAFSFPSLAVGSYTVTVTLSGFKTFVVNDVVLTSGAPASIKAVLEIGGVTEQIVVSSTSEIVQTQSTTISSTINTNQIVKLPLTSRSAMDFVTFISGVSTPGGNRQSMINGLPQGMINITLDGVNIQDNTLRSTDGFFAIVSPRLDAIEEVTVSTATQGTDASQGAVQIKFVTRSGTNQFTGSGYHYYRNDKLNANTWFNNRNGVDKPELLQNQYGARVGGPIVIPGLFDGRNKAFFFVNYEEFRQPSDTTRNRNILTTDAQRGIYRYGSSSVDLMALAAANNQTSTIDPRISKLLADIRTASGSTGGIRNTDPNIDEFSFNVPVESLNRYPTVRIDYNLTNSHRFSSAVNYQRFNTFPDTLNNLDWRFPGFPVQASQTSERLGFSNSLRSNLSQNLVNEARVGYSGAPVVFFKELNTGMFGGTSVADQGGFHLNLGTIGAGNNNNNPGQTLANAGAAPAPQSRNATSLLIEDTVTWLKGTHSFSMGGSWTRYQLWAKNSNLVPRISFDVVNGDPALGLFVGANFPGASAAQITGAQRLYALLTGRVSEIDGDARLDEGSGQYAFMGTGTQRARMEEAGLFFQDQWRLRPNLTINLGLRYELQFPFTPGNDSYSTGTIADLCGVSGVASDGRSCNLFQAGVMPGKRPEFVNFAKGVDAYNTDYNNWAPSVGFAWTLNRAGGFLGKITGQDGDSVIRGGFTRAYNRSGLNDFTGQYNANPGVIIQTPDRNLNNNNLNNDGAGLPVLFRQTGRLGAAAFPNTPVYPMTDVIGEDYNLFDPDITVPYADSWTFGIQRALGQAMALEVRYVGTRSREGWQVLNYNEVNIFENKFIDEFRLAQQNLRSHVVSGCGGTGNACSFAYRGPGTGTSPLPIILAYFSGLSGAAANDPTRYTSASFTDSTTFLAPLATFNPNPFTFATNLYNNATRRTNAANAGIPANFFLANPDLQGGADLTTNQQETDYHSLQIELRRRYAQGLQFQTSYVFGKAMTSRFETFRRPIDMVRDTGSPGDLTHAFKANVVYDLPFGQGRRFASNAGAVMDRIVGGWSLGVTSRIQSGQLVNLGNVRLVGMSVEDVEDMFKLRFDNAGRKIYLLPQEVIDETIKAFSVSATSASGYSTGVPSGRYFAPANGPDCLEVDNGADYGECGTRTLVVHGPMFQQTDISVAKRINLVGSANFEFRAELLNAFNHANFTPVGGIGNTLANYEVTGLTGANTARVIQLVSRINW